MRRQACKHEIAIDEIDWLPGCEVRSQQADILTEGQGHRLLDLWIVQDSIVAVSPDDPNKMRELAFLPVNILGRSRGAQDEQNLGDDQGNCD